MERKEWLPGDGDSGDAAGLSDGDSGGIGVAAAVKHLRELGALAGTGLSDDYDDGAALNGFDDLFFILDYGKCCHRTREAEAVSASRTVQKRWARNAERKLLI